MSRSCDIPFTLLVVLFLAAACGRAAPTSSVIPATTGTPAVPPTATFSPPADTALPLPTATIAPPADTALPLPTATIAPPTATLSPVQPTLGDTATRPADGMTMVYVPGGSFLMGSTGAEVERALAECEQYPDPYGKCTLEAFEVESPQHAVMLDGFWLDRTEVTNAHYDRCVLDGTCRKSRLAGDPAYGGNKYPVAGIPWQDAADYCAWVGGSLPTEAQWEYAARGKVGHIYSWGDAFDCSGGNFWDATSGCNDGYPEPAPVGSFLQGASWTGALDMAGNVWEWVADGYSAYPADDQVNPTGSATTTERILRGGSWGYHQPFVRTAYRYPVPPTANYLAVGFRCAVPAPVLN